MEYRSGGAITKVGLPPQIKHIIARKTSIDDNKITILKLNQEYVWPKEYAPIRQINKKSTIKS